ncbi:hypothetical protein AK830_g12522 [Neonectria ditissima]|uniref:Xylanolytic transcriptional activator regulatory domain-containing protein n=1 Tax=Neonectria ditissima TaxID=78410 RepID=A0A0P7B588_9HYPO|nr:hypothetical protein AK830_g12522 [Neonectria ditissima]
MANSATTSSVTGTTTIPDHTTSQDSTTAPGTASSVGGDPDVEAAGGSIKRRAPIACRSIFPVRGQPDNDREFRHPRMRADKTVRRDPAKVRRDILEAPVVRPPSQKISDEWDRLPPVRDLIEGIRQFTRYYFQHGFIPKHEFPLRLHNDPRSVSVFLVVSILSISARLTPCLATRYGSGLKAAEFFMERASQLGFGEIYREPTLERCQGFYLLSIAQQGSGLRNMSYINMGVSMRMASLMRLHREETYQVQNQNPDVIMRAESARRTLWMLHSQDQLHSSPYSPVSLAASDITALLPCNEQDFAAGRQPRSRAALDGTPPAIENPALVFDPGRSLFASLIQAHHFWGVVSRRAVNFARSASPWDPMSEFALLTNKLREWEHRLPQDHQWSHYILNDYKADSQDLAYLGVTMIPRLCNIVSRRPYLLDILTLGSKDEHRQAYFSNLALELFQNVRRLFDQIDAQFTDRNPDESVGAQMAAFCVYSCGLFSTYLCRYPHICPDPMITRDGPIMLHRTLAILTECKEVWPLAARWLDALERFAHDPSDALTAEGGMADGRDPFPNPVMFTNASVHAAALSVPSPSSSSIYGQTRGSFDATQSSSALQSPSSHELMTPLTTPAAHIISQHFTQPSQQQQQQPLSGPDPQTFSHQHLPTHLYMTSDTPNPRNSNPGNSNPLGMLINAFDTPQNAYALANDNPIGASTVANNSLYPSADGYEGELQFYINGPQDWLPPNGVFEGYG